MKQFALLSLIGGALRCEANPGERLADVDVARLYSSAVTVTDLFPHLKTLPVNRTWAGVEGVMPDNIPVLGHSGRASNVVHAFGFSAHGFEMSPVVGRIVSELVVDRRSSLPIDAFAIGRFQGSPA